MTTIKMINSASETICSSSARSMNRTCDWGDVYHCVSAIVSGIGFVSYLKIFCGNYLVSLIHSMSSFRRHRVASLYRHTRPMRADRTTEEQLECKWKFKISIWWMPCVTPHYPERVCESVYMWDYRWIECIDALSAHRKYAIVCVCDCTITIHPAIHPFQSRLPFAYMWNEFHPDALFNFMLPIPSYCGLIELSQSEWYNRTIAYPLRWKLWPEWYRNACHALAHIFIESHWICTYFLLMLLSSSSYRIVSVRCVRCVGYHMVRIETNWNKNIFVSSFCQFCCIWIYEFYDCYASAVFSANSFHKLIRRLAYTNSRMMRDDSRKRCTIC